MDKQGNILTGKEDEFLRSFREEGLEKDEEEAPRKVTLSEYLSSPEFQRKRKIERELKDREAFEKKMAFRSAQEQNPIKGRAETETWSEGAVIVSQQPAISSQKDLSHDFTVCGTSEI